MTDVFDQVEEELRSDRYTRWARRWLPVIGAVLAVALVAALAFWGYQNWQTSKADKASAAYDRGLESLQTNNLVTADAAFIQAAKEGNAAYRALSLIQRGGIAQAQKKDADALARFDEAAKASREPLLADLAALRAAWVAMDTQPLADVEKRLEPLAKDGRPFAAYAQEALALARLQNGQVQPARSALLLLRSGLDVPQDVSERAAAAIAQIDAGTASNLTAIARAEAAIPAAPTVAQEAPAPSGRP